MRHKLYYVTGSKGGIGKTLVSKALVFWQLENARTTRIIDTDESTWDVARVYESILPGTFRIPLNESNDSWREFLNKLHELSDAVGESVNLHVVVNSGARDNKAMEKQGHLINGIFQENRLPYDFTTLWVLSDSTDSVNLLRSYLEGVHIGNLFVFRNLHFGGGKEENFSVFNEAFSTDKEFKRRIDKVLNFPVLERVFAERIHKEGLLFSEFGRDLNWGDRMFFEGWVNGFRYAFNDMDTTLAKLEPTPNSDSEMPTKPGKGKVEK